MKVKYHLKNNVTNDLIKLKSIDDSFEFDEKFNDYHLFGTVKDKTVDFGLIKDLNYHNGSAILVENFPDSFFRPQFSEWVNERMSSWGQSYITAEEKSDYFLFNKILSYQNEDYTISYAINGPEYVASKPFEIILYFESSQKYFECKFSVPEFIEAFQGNSKKQESSMKNILSSLNKTKKLKP